MTRSSTAPLAPPTTLVSVSFSFRSPTLEEDAFSSIKRASDGLRLHSAYAGGPAGRVGGQGREQSVGEGEDARTRGQSFCLFQSTSVHQSHLGMGTPVHGVGTKPVVAVWPRGARALLAQAVLNIDSPCAVARSPLTYMTPSSSLAGSFSCAQGCPSSAVRSGPGMDELRRKGR